jgi:hypothetical protein
MLHGITKIFLENGWKSLRYDRYDTSLPVSPSIHLLPSRTGNQGPNLQHFSPSVLRRKLEPLSRGEPWKSTRSVSLGPQRQRKEAAAAKLDPSWPETSNFKPFFNWTFERHAAFSSVGKRIYGYVQHLKSSNLSHTHVTSVVRYYW